MQEVLQNDEKFSRVDRETVEAINLFAGTDIDIDEKDEVIDMCKAWEEQKNEGRELGREEGRELGREEEDKFTLVRDKDNNPVIASSLCLWEDGVIFGGRGRLYKYNYEDHIINLFHTLKPNGKYHISNLYQWDSRHHRRQ